ncbi:Mitochondrial import inner membrane translocase subunit TIM50-C [Halotydeus destructor]|nr:Mitochondrial import inner membrane translocase subunit TIM50-C [Halotydeus destructor]
MISFTRFLANRLPRSYDVTFHVVSCRQIQITSNNPFNGKLPVYRHICQSKPLITSLTFVKSPFADGCRFASQLGDKSTIEKEHEEEAAKNRRSQVRTTKYTLITLGSALACFVAWGIMEWGPPRTNEKGEPIEDKYSKMPLVKQYILRCWDTLTNYNEALKEPVRDLLLPDPLQAPYIQPPYTLVIESNGILMHPDWTYRTGWRFKKRPFVEYLLQQCAPPLFEIVIFTQDSAMVAYPLIDQLDPNGYVMYRLFRESTRYEDGDRIKDLNGLNRDLSRVIMVDWEENACRLNKANCLILKKWEGEDGDKELFELAQFIRAIAAQDVQDVREVLSHYRQFENPLDAFKERQRQLLEQENEMKKFETSKKPSLTEAFKRK